MHMWTSGGSLPLARLQNVARVPSERWPSVWGTLARFFTVTDGVATQGRLVRELAAAQARRETARENGLKGGRPKNLPVNRPVNQRGNRNGNPQKTSSPSPSYSPSDPTPTSTGDLAPAAPTPIKACRDFFVEQWENTYREKYPFAVKDGTQLAAMLKASPHLAQSWAGTVSRYLDDAWWGEHGRHGLAALCANVVKFSGPALAAKTKTEKSIDVARDWYNDRKTGG
jgi:hypothetical protein